MKALVACEESQAVTIELRKQGVEAYSCDIQECSGGHPEWHLHCDVKEVINDDWDLLIAHPVCKRLANSGVRWLHVPPPGKTKEQIWQELDDAIEFYRLFQEAKIPLKAIENPVMHRYAKERLNIKRRQVVQPWWFGDKTFKATGFELHGLPDLVPTDKLNPPEKGTQEYKEWSWVHRMSPGPDREKLRSKSQPGVAKAMAEQWGKF